MTTTTARETEHTPGPWGVSPDGVCVVSADATYQTHTDENGKEYQHPDKLIALPYGCVPGSREANARLIAAAPELLRELRALVEWVERETDGRDWPNGRLEAARAVIAKTMGGGAR